MGTIGIIANPASGKDIRRLVSHATVIDNHEKINIVERIILAAQNLGVEKMYIMPDYFHMGIRAKDNLSNTKELTSEVEVLDMKMKATSNDSTVFASKMEEIGTKCIVVLGGDGTSRAAAKSIGEIPLISVSTGTNNVYPDMIEGTVAGMAAAVVTSGLYDVNDICRRDKRIEIFKNGNFVDIALIDAVISKKMYVGSRAIWDLEDIIKVIVSRCHPASIGFSSLLGCRIIINEEDDFGAYADMNSNNNEDRIIAPIAAGIIKPFNISEPETINLNQEYFYEPTERGIIALDGEREIPFKEGDKIAFKIVRKGPNRVNVKKALEIAQQSGFFMCKN